MHVVAEGADRRLAQTGLTALHGGDERRLALGRTVVDNRLELASSPVRFYAVALPEITFDWQRMPQDKRPGQWKAVTTLLAGKCGCPQVAPRLLTIDHRVHVGHAVGVALADLVQHETNVVEQTVVSGTEGVLLAERQRGLSRPIPEWVIGEKLARERGDRRVIDAIRGYAEACSFERDDGAAAKGVEHGDPVGMALREFCYQSSVSSVPASHRLAHEVLEMSLFGLVIRPRQKAGEDRCLSLREWPCGEPCEQCLLAFPATPAASRSLADLCAGKPSFDHAHVTDSSFSRAALRALPGTCTMTAPVDKSAKIRAGSG